MNRYLKFFGPSIVLVLLGWGCQPFSDNAIEAVSLDFVPDAGIRVENASNPGLLLSESGSLTLLYEDQAERGQKIAQSTEASDWLDFGASETVTDISPYRATRLPDGTYRSYGYDPTVGQDSDCLKSRSSTDGQIFTADEGCRYTLTADDQGWMGVYDLFIGPDDEVILLYLGDKWGLNNIRRAVSTDNGWTFTFDEGDILHDAKNGGGMNSYVDERVIKLADGRYFLIAMQKGSIYAFLSNDGYDFSEATLLLSPSEFVEKNLTSLNDPQIIQLPDGRYRIYVTGIEDLGSTSGSATKLSRDLKSYIFSATTFK